MLPKSIGTIWLRSFVVFVIKYKMVSSGDYWRAVDVWDKNYKHDDPGKRFMEYLGIESFLAQHEGFRLPEHSIARIKTLLGPHARTIIKAWYVTKGELNET